MPLEPAPDHEAGGLLYLEYTDATIGERHSLRLHLAHFNPAPAGPSNDYLYDGSGPVVPAEASVLATTAAVCARLAPYFRPTWLFGIVSVWYNSRGVLTELPVVPTFAPLAGTNTDAAADSPAVKRTFTLRNADGSTRRLYLTQLPGTEVGVTVSVTPTSGGFSVLDQALMGYLSGSATGIVGRDGEHFLGLARVRNWWARNPEPPSGSGAGGGGGGTPFDGHLPVDCLDFPQGARICNTNPGELRFWMPDQEHAMDATGILLPGGHRLEASVLCPNIFPYLELPTNDGAVAYWPLMNDAVFPSEASDATGNGYDGGWVGGDPTWVPGPLACTHAPQFGAGQGMLVGRTDGLPYSFTPFILEFWFRIDAPPAPGESMALVTWGARSAPTSMGLAVYAPSPGRAWLVPWRYDGFDYADLSANWNILPYCDGGWHYAAFTSSFPGDSLLLFVDGANIGGSNTFGVVPVLPAVGDVLYIGDPGLGSVANLGYRGAIAQVAIYPNVVMSPDFIAARLASIYRTVGPVHLRLRYAVVPGLLVDCWTHDHQTWTVYSDDVVVLRAPFDTLAQSPDLLMGKDPSTGIPVYCPPPVVTGATVGLGGGGGGQSVPPGTCTQMRCGVSGRASGHLDSLYDQWVRWLDPLIAGITDFAAIALLIDPFFDGLLATLEVASDIAVAKAIKEVLQLGVGAISGSLFPGLDADEQQSVQQPLFCQLACVGDTISVTASNISVWHDAVANLTTLPGLSRDLLTILLQFTPLADWQAAAASSGPSSACDAWTCP